MFFVFVDLWFFLNKKEQILKIFRFWVFIFISLSIWIFWFFVMGFCLLYDLFFCFVGLWSWFICCLECGCVLNWLYFLFSFSGICFNSFSRIQLWFLGIGVLCFCLLWWFFCSCDLLVLHVCIYSELVSGIVGLWFLGQL